MDAAARLSYGKRNLRLWASLLGGGALVSVGAGFTVGSVLCSLAPNLEALIASLGLAPDEKVRRNQHRFEPLQKRIAGGCHLTRDPVDVLEAHGFDTSGLQAWQVPDAPPVASPAWAGHLVRR